MPDLSGMMSPLNGSANLAWNVVKHRLFLVQERRRNSNYVSPLKISPSKKTKAIIKSQLHKTKRAICNEILTSFHVIKERIPFAQCSSHSLRSSPSLSSSVMSDEKDKIGCFWGQWLIWNSNNSSHTAPLRGRETRGISFIWLNVLEVSVSPDIKQQQPWRRTQRTLV